jgi:hypothetical protein
MSLRPALDLFGVRLGFAGIPSVPWSAHSRTKEAA